MKNIILVAFVYLLFAGCKKYDSEDAFWKRYYVQPQIISSDNNELFQPPSVSIDKEFLLSRGVTFPGLAKLNFSTGDGTLLMYNTKSNHRRMAEIFTELFGDNWEIRSN